MLDDREALYAAVFALFSEAAEFKTTGRRLKTWSDCGRDQQPALFMAQGNETAVRTKGLPGKWTLTVKLFLYAHAPNDEAPVGPVMNPLLDAIVRRIEKKELPNGAWRDLHPGELNNLGIPGVSHCWIEGSIDTDEGALGSQGVAIIPISILVA